MCSARNDDAILIACTTSGTSHRISGSDISLCVTSPFSLYCKYHVDYAERDPRDVSQAIFSEYGHSHEAKLMQDRYIKKSEDKPTDDAHNHTTIRAHRPVRPRMGRAWRVQDPVERAAQLDQARARAFGKTLLLMRRGEESLLEPQLCFLPQGMHGAPDILEKRQGESGLGQFHYVVKEIKSSKKIRRKHVLQTAFYNLMLGHIQGYTPAEFYILNAYGEDTVYAYDDYKDEIDKVIEEVTRIKDGYKPPVAYGRGIFPWINYTDKTAISNDDLSIITGMEGRDRRILEDMGISTVAMLADTDPAALKRAGIRHKRALAHVARASALKSGEAVMMGPLATIQSSSTDIFLRIEDGLSGDVYMIGAQLYSPADTGYVSFVAKGDGGEAAMLNGFLDFLNTQHNAAIYYWGSGGKTPLSRLMRKHCDGMDPPPIPMRDLQKVSVQTVAFPVYRLKLKSVAEWIGFEWTDPEAEWGKGFHMYRRYIRDDACQDCLEYIQTYNRDNCEAIHVVWKWLYDHGRLKRA